MSMKQIKVEKVTLNCGCGTDNVRLEKSFKLLNIITNKKPIRTKTSMRIANWGLRKGLPIGTKVTVRGEDAKVLIARMIAARDNRLPSSCVDKNGNISFGIKESIDIPGVEYDPEIGILGLQCTITLTRPGYRVARRQSRPQKIPVRHKIKKEEAMAFAKEQLNIGFLEDEE